MKVNELLRLWQQTAAEPRAAHEYAVRLPLRQAARIQALSSMFPGRNPEQIIVDLLSATLDELEEAFPYVQGQEIVAEDEFGDPVYADAGPSPRFKTLTERHLRELQQRRSGEPE